MNTIELGAISNSNLSLEYDTHTHKYFRYTWILETIHIVYIAVATEVIYCDSNGEDNYICSIPDLSFRFSKVEAHYIGLQIDEFEHGDN